MFYKNWVARPNPSAEDILKNAKMLNGVPYLWGGTSIKGVDCSGFTKTCYFLNGIIIPRDASQQALVGEKVDIYENDTVNINKCLKNLQAGDLLFFAAGKNRRPNPKITHTAIYMGKGEFIQSAGSVGINSIVSTSDIYDSFGSRTLVCARRILNSIGTPEISRVDQHPFYKPSSK
jgi:cell wall-associated NlpC family hydrolase